MRTSVLALATTLFLSGASHAAPAAAPSKAPLGALVSNEATEAYQFRTRMGVDPQCQELAQEADKIFMDDSLTVENKAQQLKGVEARAKAARCLQ